MSLFLLIGLVLLFSVLFSNDSAVYDIPEEFQNCPEVARMKAFYNDRYELL
ncbi:endoglucanase [Clostridium neuense]|uniref:Endoglucanase n=1 Tax=Clostridium neuense TaxID=1728934 RepID=A0ABW8TJ42_9CLOT